MKRFILRDDQWERLEALCSGMKSDRRVTGQDNRLLLKAASWIVRTGSPWRALPKSFGKWHNVYNRFARWSEKGVWSRIAKHLSDDPDWECRFLDSTIVRAHQHSVGAKKRGPQTIERHCGGPTTKIYAAADALGNPARAIVVDKTYDSSELVKHIESRKSEVVIPPKENRTYKREYDRHAYKNRNLIERFLIASSNFEGWQHATNSLIGATWRCCISCSPSYGCSN